jgi:Hypoxia induced protein conserved region
LPRWLRFRVIAQGVTIAAAVAGGWKISQDRRAARKSGRTAAAEEAAKGAKEQAEKERFSSRMKEAEEAHQLETGAGGK